MRHFTFLLTILLLIAHNTAYPQLALPGAGDGKIGLISGTNSLTVDINQAKLGLNFTTSTYLKGNQDCNHIADEDERQQCVKERLVLSLNTNHWFVEGNFAFAAQKGKRALIDDARLSPGVEASFVIGRFLEEGSISSGFGGYNYLYGGPIVKFNAIKTYTIDNMLYTFDTETEKNLGFRIGWNSFFTESLGFGISFTGFINENSPRLDKIHNVSVYQSQGQNSTGNSVVAMILEERYKGPLGNDNTTQTRVEGIVNFPRPGKESFGLLGGISLNTRSGYKATGNIAFGPVVHPKGRPNQVLLATLFTFTDITDANDRNLIFTEDIFSLQLYLGIPLTGF